MLFECPFGRTVWLFFNLHGAVEEQHHQREELWLKNCLDEFERLDKKHDTEFEITFACVLWWIWRAKNISKFDTKKQNPWQVITNAENTRRNYSEMENGDTNIRQMLEANISWKQPETGKLQLCSDGSVHKTTGGARAGCVLRGDMANFIWGISLPLRSSDILAVETKALEIDTVITSNWITSG